jgi:competence protein ComEC
MAMAALVAPLALVALMRGGARLALAAVAALVVVGAWTWSGARLQATAAPEVGGARTVQGTVVVETHPVPGRDGRARVRVRAESLAGAGEAVPRGARLLAWVEFGPGLGWGDVVRVRGRLGPAAGREAPSWWRRYLKRQRISGRLTVRHAEVVGRRRGLAGMRDRWREWTWRHAARGLSGDRAAVVRGMALGASGDLSESAARQMRDAGVWHLLAVSGQNVTVVALAVLGLLRAMGARRRPSVLAALVALLAYCLACDGGPSVARAGIVGALGLIGELQSMARQRWHLLLVALAGLLLADPRALGDPGLQLSFAAVVGLFVTAPVLQGVAGGWLPARVAQLAALAGGAGLATAPVLVWHFERLSLVGLVVNVVAVPLAAPVVIVALVGIPAAAAVPPLGILLSWIAGLGGEALLLLAASSAAVPGAAVDVPRVWAAPLLVLPAVPHIARAALPRMSRAQRGAVAIGLAGLTAGLTVLLTPSPRPWPAHPEVRILDVGQGNAVLIRDPGGAAALMDTGPPGDPPAIDGRLRRLGVDRLDLLIVSHGSLDHVGGMEAVLRRAPPRAVAMGPEIPPRQHRVLRRRFIAAGATVYEVAAGDAFRVGRWAATVVAPRGRRFVGGDPNPRSLVVRLSGGRAAALLTSDAESDALDAVPTGVADLLMVAHHGSRDGGLAQLLRRVRPRVAAVSVGVGNRYGHPAPETLAALRNAGAAVGRTDELGDVWMRIGSAGAPHFGAG